MDDCQIEYCEQQVNYKFQNQFWIRKALTHSSNKGSDRPSNERLEFLGDAVLGLVVSEHLFHRLKGRSEGELTKIKSRVVSRVSLAKRSIKLNLDKCISVGKGMLDCHKLPMSVMANVMEAVIGAIFVDGGLKAAKEFILSSMAIDIDEAIVQQESGNFKSLLQQYAQRVFSSTPTYEVLQHTGPDHDKKFQVIAVIGDVHHESAWGRCKKEAEQRAAEMTFLNLTGPSIEVSGVNPTVLGPISMNIMQPQGGTDNDEDS